MVKRSVTELHRTDEMCNHQCPYGAAQPGVVDRQTYPKQVSILDGWCRATAKVQNLMIYAADTLALPDVN